MPWTAGLVVLISLALIAAVVVVLARGGHPESTASHAGDDFPPRDSRSQHLYRGVDRPAGPDAEDTR